MLVARYVNVNLFMKRENHISRSNAPRCSSKICSYN